MREAFEIKLRALTQKQDVFVILAVSGGVDSMVMASLFVTSSYKKLAIAHVNFKLRGADSDADEALVRRWAEAFEIPFYVQRFDTQSYAKERGLSVEMAARALRYTWFEQLRQELEADYIAVAHHANDHAETILLNLTRGTGIRGLCGIPDRRGAIIRPMLHFGRAQIEAYARKRQIPYREDVTNALCDFARNRIRHTVLPELAKINPRVVEQLGEDALHLREAHAILEEALEKKRADWCREEGEALFLQIEKISKEPHAAYWLFELLRPYGFGSGQMDQVMDTLQAQPGRRVFSSTHILYKDRALLALFPREQEGALPKVKTLFFDRSSYSLQKKSEIAALNADKLQIPLVLRKWREGDRFIPYGMKGFKKVSDFLTDLKLPLWEKERQWVLCSGADIVWVAGRRIDDRYKVDGATQSVAEVSLESF